MAEDKQYVSQGEEKGAINISEEVIASIAATSAVDVPGVSGLAAGGLDLGELLGKKVTAKGVRLQIDDGGITADLYLTVQYGYTVVDVAKKVQETVASSIESMTGLKVTVVNVHVTGITFAPEEEQA